MKVGMYSDELYPYYDLSDDYGDPREVPEELVERWRSVMAAFRDVQDEMAEFYNKDDAE